ncbi:MAG: uroporphyrinogen-III C-methyltransferase [Culicoidibacterales bacterium]
MKRAHLYLAGCGPYHEELTTSTLKDFIAETDVILYDRLINKALLSHASPNTIIEYVGKDIKEKTNTQITINTRILFYLNQNKRVLRLKSGDPFLFGRGFEEYKIAKHHHFPVTIIPGVSSSLAIASSIGLPLTLRDVSHGITILTGMNAKNQVPEFSYQNKQHSYVFLMSVKNFDTIAKQMISSGFPSSTLAIAISNGTYPNQQITCATLPTLSHKMQKYNQKNPAIIIVSPTISHWKKYYYPKILATKIDSADFGKLDHAYQLETTHIPLLSPSPLSLSDTQFKQLNEAKTIIISSPITAEYAKNIAINWKAKEIVVIGPKTKQISDTLFQNVIYDQHITSLQSYIDKYSTKNTVVLTSSYGKDIRLNEDFNHIIIPIFELNTNSNRLPTSSFDAITVYSPSTLEALVESIQNDNITEFFTLPLFCFGKNVYELAHASPFQNTILVETNQHEQFYQHIYLYFKERFSL